MSPTAHTKWAIGVIAETNWWALPTLFYSAHSSLPYMFLLLMLLLQIQEQNYILLIEGVANGAETKISSASCTQLILQEITLET